MPAERFSDIRLSFQRASNSWGLTTSMGTRLADIQDVTTMRIRNVLRKAVREGLDAELVADFLASVNWSGMASADEKIAQALGQLEAWSTGYAEGELTRAAYVARLLSLLPQRERSRRLVMGGSVVSITIAGTIDRQRPEASPLRNVSDVRYLPVPA